MQTFLTIVRFVLMTLGLALVLIVIGNVGRATDFHAGLWFGGSRPSPRVVIPSSPSVPSPSAPPAPPTFTSNAECREYYIRREREDPTDKCSGVP